MRVIQESVREYEMDADRILSNPDFNPPGENSTIVEKEDFLRESFYELCGWERDEDHIDGSYVKLVHDDGTTTFEWSYG